MIFVTGAAGFIGSNFVHSWLESSEEGVISYDALTYAGNLDNLGNIKGKNHNFFKGDIGDEKKITKLLDEFKPRAILNFAAESHVDRSIESPKIFLETNVMGTYNLLQCTYNYWNKLEGDSKDNFRFLHISTDEVFGSLDLSDESFKETDQYKPNSPYSASKASSDHLVRSFYKTYGLPVITSNCSNNYGPYQYPEKLIPMTILNFINRKKVPVYGDGKQVRDWLHVLDHCEALKIILEKSEIGEVYNIGAENEMQNIDLIMFIGSILERHHLKGNFNSQDFIDYVQDRPGHDKRYSINSKKVQTTLGWEPKISFKDGIEETIKWYLENPEWVDNIYKKITTNEGK